MEGISFLLDLPPHLNHYAISLENWISIYLHVTVSSQTTSPTIPIRQRIILSLSSMEKTSRHYRMSTVSSRQGQGIARSSIEEPRMDLDLVPTFCLYSRGGAPRMYSMEKRIWIRLRILMSLVPK